MQLIDRFTSTPRPAEAGKDVKICFTNPALAGTIISVELDNGDGNVIAIDITLNSDGHGCTTWSVPAAGWNLINMNQPTSLEHTTPVV